MSRPSYLAQPIIQRLPNLLREIQTGDLRIPRFQRPFVWTSEQRLLLMSSIYKGIPIGSILIWRTLTHDLECYENLGHLHLDWSSKEKIAGSPHQYVIDGHQRLTTLYVTLGQGLEHSTAGSEQPARPDDARIDKYWEIFFDLNEKSFNINTHGDTPPASWLPLSILLDPFQLYVFTNQLLATGADRVLINRAESLASTFKDYSIPVVPIATENFELATESFERLNSSGTPMTEVQMLSALTWTPSFDLNERMQEIQIELGEIGWESLDERVVLNVCKAILNLDIHEADTQSIRDALKKQPQVLEEATESLKAAAGFLREWCKVCGPSTLPYSFQVVLLAEALRHGTDGFKQEPTAEALDRLEKWFWLTTYTEHFAGISAGRLARTLKHLRGVATGAEDPEPPDLVREVSSFRRFDFRTARSRAIALRMADLQARVQPNPDPYQLLAEHGRDAMPMLIPSREVGGGRLAEGPENRILAHPRETTLLRRLLREPGSMDPELLESHAIDEGSARALLQGNLSEFLSLRRLTLNRLEQEFVERLGLAYSFD